MKTRPILLSGPMVRAILSGAKTQTRRVVKPQPQLLVEPDGRASWRHGNRIGSGPSAEAWTWHALDRCPFGQPGDRLWVRETWADLRGKGFDGQVGYGADTRPGSDGDQARIAYGIKWKPSIHMPRWASRITLEITDVRVERLQEISEEDAKAEGAENVTATVAPGMEQRFSCARQGFAVLWDELAKSSSDWSANPWVWVIEFRRLPC